MKVIIAVLTFIFIPCVTGSQLYDPAQSIQTEKKNEVKVDYLKPPVYTAALMTLDLGFMLITGIADNPPSYQRFKEGFSLGPAPDEDHWLVNWVSHPLMGSETYLRAREGNWGWFGSFLFSTAASLSWEFIWESWTERPSTQDLLITSTTGSVLGEIRYHLKRKLNPKHHWFVDPIHTLYLTIGGKR